MNTTARITWTRVQPGAYEADGRWGRYTIQQIGRTTWALSNGGPETYHPTLTVARERADNDEQGV